jgi:hypothetical protein
MSIWIDTGLLLLSAGCGEPMFDNAGSQNSLLEDREACALENADYEWHSLAMLNRIAAALDQRVELRVVPVLKAKD